MNPTVNFGLLGMSMCVRDCNKHTILMRDFDCGGHVEARVYRKAVPSAQFAVIDPKATVKNKVYFSKLHIVANMY